ncbi:MAG: ScyD/ScyE family protein [Chloroflexota bacterium]|nr:ScyD/ScyE family protein [Chloroflexia bacterium]MDQ3227635.1 ScyD/ScyE family protein [Chloroflexota bacterium]
MYRSLLLGIALAIALIFPVAAQEATPAGGPTDGLTVVASGLTNPRGFLWTADGSLWVAQAGNGGANEATEEAPTTEAIGPWTGGPSASVVRIEAGCPVLVAGGLPSSADTIGGVLGAEDVAILGGQLYASVDGGGAVHGNAAQPSGVYRILADGAAELVADLSAWVRANPVANIPPDFDPDAAGYSLVADEVTGTFWVVDPNSGQILQVGLDGSVSRIADLSEGHPVPTGLAAAPEGGVYVGFLTAAPFPDNASRVVYVAPDGALTEVWTGLTMVTDVAVGPDGTLYAAEMSTGNLTEPPFLVPGSGRIVRQRGESAEVVASGLMFPVSLAFGPDGALYSASPALGSNQGEGVIARLDVPEGSVMATPVAMLEAEQAAECAPVAAATPVA